MSAILLSACVTSKEINDPIRITPEIPPDLSSCFEKQFPIIPDRDLTSRDIVRIISDAKRLDKIKTSCGERAIIWMKDIKNLEK